MPVDPEVSELKFRVQGLEQDVRELQRIINEIRGLDQSRTPASAEDTPVRPREVAKF